MNFETPGPVEEGLAAAISPIGEIIEAARQGDPWTGTDLFADDG